MTIEQKIFERYKVNFSKLISYGFLLDTQKYIFVKNFFDNLFKMVIVIDNNGCVEGKVFDNESNDEFLPLRVKNQDSAFISKVKRAYEESLIDIRKKCFVKQYYIYSQSNRIAEWIIKKYNTEPEFLWESSPGASIFRNTKTEKWFAVILNLDKSKIIKKTSGNVEIINLKLSPEKIKNYITISNFYPAYHMNKKHWITIILNDSIADDVITDLIMKSYEFSCKK